MGQTRASERPVASSESIRQKMVGQRRRDTKPELEIRNILYSRGYRYRVQYSILNTRRKVDIAFTKHKVAVFVDGCFWHSCPDHQSVPKKNTDWWIEKLKSNVERDRDTDALLLELGWQVVRIWEHEDPATAVERVLMAICSANV